jgi:hypothetical protein
MEHYRRKSIDNGAILYAVALKLPEDMRGESSAGVFSKEILIGMKEPMVDRKRTREISR